MIRTFTEISKQNLNLIKIPIRGYKIDVVHQQPASGKNDLKKELTFKSFNLLHEITHVLENQMKITTP